VNSVNTMRDGLSGCWTDRERVPVHRRCTANGVLRRTIEASSPAVSTGRGQGCGLAYGQVHTPLTGRPQGRPQGERPGRWGLGADPLGSLLQVHGFTGR